MSRLDDDLQITVEKKVGLFQTETSSIRGRYSHYEETYDASGLDIASHGTNLTESGWYKFRKDVAAAAGITSTNFVIEVKSNNKWEKVHSGPGLDVHLQHSKASKQLTVRVTEESGSYVLPMIGAVAAVGIAAAVYSGRLKIKWKSFD